MEIVVESDKSSKPLQKKLDNNHSVLNKTLKDLCDTNLEHCDNSLNYVNNVNGM